MNPVFRKLQVSVTQQAFVLNQALTLCRATPCTQHPVWACMNTRQYKSMPTHGIGRWRHLVAKEPLQVSVTQQAFVLNQALTLCRATPCTQHPVWACMNTRQYKSMPTHGIGRWRHLVAKEPLRKKKDKPLMKPILAATSTAHGTLNVTVSGYDMTLVEHYSQYIHNLCNRLGIKVSESYALPTKSTEVMLMQEQGTKMFVEATLKSHQRVVQLSSLNATLSPVFMDVMLKNQPEGVQLSVTEHSEADYHGRFKSRPELDGLLAQMHRH